MKVIAFSGSTRRNGNTEKLLNIFLDINYKSSDIVYYNLLDLDFKDCTACYGCANNGKCVLKDDLTSVYDEIDKADTVILASPIYFNSVTSLSKKLVDRMQCYWSRKYILKNVEQKQKNGIFISSGGAQYTKTQFLGATLVMDYFFKALNCKNNTSVLVSNTDKIKVENKDKFHILGNFKDYIGKEIIINN